MAASIVERFENGVVTSIDHSKLSEIAQAGAVSEARVYGAKGGWTIVVSLAGNERALTVSRGGLRMFRKFESLLTYLTDVGISKFSVDTTEYEEKTDTKGRPDRAEALRHAHTTAAYDKWFRESVQASIDDPRPSLTHEEVETRFAERRRGAALKGAR